MFFHKKKHRALKSKRPTLQDALVSLARLARLISQFVSICQVNESWNIVLNVVLQYCS